LLDTLKKFEKIIFSTLAVLISFVVFVSTLRLVWRISVEMIEPPFLLLNTEQLLTIFDLFLIILIGLELLETIKIYITHGKTPVEVILTVALIAAARKVITLEYTKLPSLTLVGIASIIIALAAGYHLIKKAPLK
jgi:uncharacterized membrane protein (DUF373 family)